MSSARSRREPANAEVRKVLHEIYQDTFISAAFQSAIFVTFFAAIDVVNEQRSKPPEAGEAMAQEEVEQLFEEYMGQVNSAFSTRDLASLTRLFNVFHGPMTVAGTEVTLAPFSEALRHIVIPGELKPDEWPKFRYMILEVWRPKNKEVSAQLDETRRSMRKHVLDSYVSRKTRALAASLAKRELDKKETAEVSSDCVKHMTAGLKALCSMTDRAAEKLNAELMELVKQPEEIDPVEADA